MDKTKNNFHATDPMANHKNNENQTGGEGRNQRERMTLKRRRNQLWTNGRRNGRKKPKESDYAQIFRCSNFKLFAYKQKERLRKKLYIFDVVDDSELCHKYVWNEMSVSFECYTCVRDSKKHISTAKLYKKETNYVEFGFHGCKAYKYDPGRCEERTKIYKPEYKIIKGIIDGEERHRLFIFDPTNKELCYVYSLSSDLLTYECLGCRRFRKLIKAKFHFENTENEYLELYNEEHVCELRPYDSEKIFRNQKIVQSSDFEFQKVFVRGREVQKLIIFASDDKKYCYEYNLEKSTFRCRRCDLKNHGVYAKYDYAENILRLCSNPHICERQIYVPEKFRKEIVLERSKFKIIRTLRKQDSKQIIIFHETEKKLCYSFSRSYNHDLYSCNGCRQKNGTYVVNLCEDKSSNIDENENFFLKMKPNQKHICIPKKLADFEVPEIIKTTNYMFYQNRNEAKKMVIFTSSERKYCYEYIINSKSKNFICWKCKTKTATSKFYQNQNGVDDYFEYLPKKHTCKPISYNVIKPKITKILKPNECITAKKSKEKTTNFELRADKNNVKDAVLILFHPDDTNLCYHYKYVKGEEKYLCGSCSKKNLKVSAILHTDENGQKYIVQGERKHECDAIEYVPENEIKRFTNFIAMTDKNVEKLIVFTSDEKTHCYVYRKAKNTFKCIRCTPTKYVMVKLLTDENGMNYVEFGTQEHFCVPQKYNPAKYAISKQLSENEFELFPNTKGVPDSRIIILDSNDSNFGYEYKFTDHFNCSQCLLVAKKRIAAKLIKKENEEKYLELSKNEHLCQKLNFFEIGRIVYSTDYEFNSGEENQTITVTHQKDKKLCYKFTYDSNLKVFYCIGCQKKKKFISAKIYKRSNSDEFLLLAFDHVCVPVSV